MTATQIQLRPLTDEEKLVKEYIRQHPNENQEEVIISFCSWDEIERRETIAGAIGHLIHNDYICEKNGQLTVRGE